MAYDRERNIDTGWRQAAYQDGQLDMESQCQAEIARMRAALEKINEILSSSLPHVRRLDAIRHVIARELEVKS